MDYNLMRIRRSPYRPKNPIALQAVKRNLFALNDVIVISDSSDNECEKINKKNTINTLLTRKSLGKNVSITILDEELATTFQGSTNIVDSASKKSKRKISLNNNENNNKSMKVKRVTFGMVENFYFPRAQGFICVPEHGGATLGMKYKHSKKDKMTVDQFEDIKLKNISNLISSHYNICDKKSFSHYLKPISTKQRRKILLEAGVTYIDASEKKELHKIRASRQICGCDCKVFCDPNVCSCTLNDIPCQVERENFPCACTDGQCKNSNGRTIYNSLKAQQHFLETHSRINSND